MKPVHRLSGLLAVLGLFSLAGCGGGGNAHNNPTSSQNNFSGGGSNVAQITITATSNGYFNEPLTTVKICNTSNNECTTVSDVLVDTGSYGLRLMASAVSSIGLTAMVDPNTPGNTIEECLPFADGYAWGAVANASVSIAGETTTGTVPIQVIDDGSTSGPQPPSECTANGASLDSSGSNGLGANGILGVGVFEQDCGPDCGPAYNAYVYYSCPTGADPTCQAVDEDPADQVTNPVAAFPTDNNGVIVQLPAISQTGSASVTGYLVFGIGTESNNALGGAQVLTANDEGNFNTTFEGNLLPYSFIDSGSNAMFFNSSALNSSKCDPDSSGVDQFYCPTTIAALSAVNEGQNGVSTTVSFSIADINTLNSSDNAFDDVGGPAPQINNFGNYFDWGLPFFFGRTTYFALQGQPAGGTTGPYYAY